MFKKLLLLTQIIYLLAYPVNADDAFERELSEKREVYIASKSNLQLFLNGNDEFFNNFIHITQEFKISMKNVFANAIFLDNLKERKVEDVYNMSTVSILGHRELVSAQVSGKYNNIIAKNDYLVIFSFNEKYKGMFPSYMIFIYRKDKDNKWKIVMNVTEL